MSQQYTSPQANERVTTGETYEMSQPQNANSPQPSNRSQDSTLDAGPAGANDRALGQALALKPKALALKPKALALKRGTGRYCGIQRTCVGVGNRSR